jgi:maleylpyruvate isomerase
MVTAFESEIEAMTASTRSLQRTIAGLSDDDIRAPSLLPGWTRGHVLTHVARNADGLTNLATWARTGIETPMYASAAARHADIEAGAGRTAPELIADVEQSHSRLLAALVTIEPGHWQAVVTFGLGGRTGPASAIPEQRRIEVEIHHVDLDLDYTLAHLPADFVMRMLDQVAADLARRDDVPALVLVGNENEGRWTVGSGGQEITGTPPSLLGWAVGRTDGIGLFSADPLPNLGPWR